MGQYDITVKYFAGKYPSAYIRLALPDFDGTFRLLDKKLPQVEVEVDFLAEVQVGEEEQKLRSYLHSLPPSPSPSRKGRGVSPAVSAAKKA